MSDVNVVLTWQDNSSNEIDFYVERCQGADCTYFIGLATSGANIATWTDYNAAAGQSYSYRVRAWNADGYSAYSNTATIVTPGGTLIPPPAPSNLLARALTKSQVQLTWTNNTSNQNGVIIERCKGATCTNFTQIAIVTSTAYTDSALLANTTYRYRLCAYNSAGNSPYSNIAAAKTPKR